MPLSPGSIQLSSLVELKSGVGALRSDQRIAGRKDDPDLAALRTSAQRSSAELTGRPTFRASERLRLTPATSGASELQRKESNPHFISSALRSPRSFRADVETGATGPYLLTKKATVKAGNATPKTGRNRVVVDGVSIPRFQPQEAISKRYTEADLKRLDINANNTRIYVIDDFVNAYVPAGAGPTAVKTPHGEVVAGIITATLRGKGQVTRLNLGVAGKEEWDKAKMEPLIRQVIAAEAKRQNKTPSTVDLSSVTINLSYAFGGPEAPLEARAVAAFTARGGAFFVGAGNFFYNEAAARFKNSNLVDGSNTLIGGNIPKIQTPWSSYENGGVSDSGKDVRASRKLEPSSRSIIAPSNLITRVVNGAIEFRDSMSPTGWSELVSSSRTKAAPTPTTTSDGLIGFKPQKYVTVEQARKCRDLESKANEEAIKNAKSIESRGVSGLPAAALTELKNKVAALRRALIGDKPIMSIDQYLKFTGDAPDSRFYQQVIASIPEGMTSKDVMVSAAQVLNGKEAHEFQLQYFVLNANTGRLQTIQPLINMTNGTSWATPAAAASHAIWQREQVAEAKARQRV